MLNWLSWCEKDDILGKRSALNPKFNVYAEGQAGRFLSVGPVDDEDEGEPGWWDTWYTRVFADVVMWEKVRRAMGRGKLRVCVRWREVESLEKLDTSLDDVYHENDIKMDEQIGLGIYRNTIEAGIGRNVRPRADASSPSNSATSSATSCLRPASARNLHKKSPLGGNPILQQTHGNGSGELIGPGPGMSMSSYSRPRPKPLSFRREGWEKKGDEDLGME
jgi:hypothetical protein